MKLAGVEFLRRFLMHVLPGGFMRIRHFGFLANCVRQLRVKLLRELLNMAGVLVSRALGIQGIHLPLSGGVVCLCPACHQKTLLSLHSFLSFKQRRLRLSKE